MRAAWLAGLAVLAVLAALLARPAGASTATNGAPTYHHAYKVVYIDGAQAGSFAYYTKWAAAQWDKSTDVSVRYGACRAGAGCAHIVAAHRGRHTDPGLTYFGVYVGTTVLGEPLTTKFDLDYPWTMRDKYQAACHEVARDLGITWAYLYWKGSCMYGVLDRAASIYPATADRAVLNRVY